MVDVRSLGARPAARRSRRVLAELAVGGPARVPARAERGHRPADQPRSGTARTRHGSHRPSAASSTPPRSRHVVGQRVGRYGDRGRRPRVLARRRPARRSTATCRPCSTSTPTCCATGSAIRPHRRRPTRRGRRRHRRDRSPTPWRPERRRSASMSAPGRDGQRIALEEHRMRTRFAVAFGNQRSRRAARRASNRCPWRSTRRSGRSCSPRPRSARRAWTSTSGATPSCTGTCPTNPVDLEQREGRVHRYKGHAVRRNIAATLGADASRTG